MSMQLTLLGDGRLALALAQLSKRAGHTVVQVRESGADVASHAMSELVLLVGDRISVATSMQHVAPTMRKDVVVVDATIRSVEQEPSDSGESVLSNDEWMGLMPTSRVVRAFASVPVEAFIALVDQPRSHEASDLAVPLAGDDLDAKVKVSTYMREIGVEPFDLGPLAVSYVMDVQGPLFGKAVDDVSMRELVGWLAGDG
jgi:hypothetical protein